MRHFGQIVASPKSRYLLNLQNIAVGTAGFPRTAVGWALKTALDEGAIRLE
jgi:hypothetical protein